MINHTYNTKKKLKYSLKSFVNDIDSRGLQKFEAIRKIDSFGKCAHQEDKLNLIIDMPDRW